VLSCSAGNMVLKPQPDAKLVPPSPPVTVQSGQPGTAMAGALRQPMPVTPIAVGNLSAATPVQTQGYPNYFPEYYPGYDPWGWGWGAGVGVTHGAGDGLSEFPSDSADAGTAVSAAAFSAQASDASALVTLACSIRGSDASALAMRVLVAVSAAAVADRMINGASPRRFSTNTGDEAHRRRLRCDSSQSAYSFDAAIRAYCGKLF
jgi:hypothetical protein